MHHETVVAFYNYINKHKVEKGSKYTHTSCGPPYGSFYIANEELENFWGLYATAYKHKDTHMIEKQRSVGPFVLDIDLLQESNTRLYTNEHILQIHTYIVQNVCKYFDVDTSNMVGYIFEKDNPTMKHEDEYKDGFHIIYPHLALNEEMRLFLFECLKQNGEDIFDNIDVNHNVAQIYDEAVITKNGWIMYGSKKLHGNAYNLTCIYDCENNDIVDDIEAQSDYQLIKLFSIHKYNDTDCISYKSIQDENALEILKKIRTRMNKTIKLKKIEKKSCTINTSIYPSHLKSQIERTIKLVSILSNERATNYMDWISVGWTLHNIHESLYPIWLEFSKRGHDKFNEVKCKEIWEHAHYDGFTIASLHWWAKKDNPGEYTKYLNEELEHTIKDAESGSHYDIAKVLYEKYKYIYKCSSIKHKIWYEFKNNRWHEIDSAYTLSQKISTELVNDFYKLLSICFDQCSKTTDDKEQEILRKKGEYLNKIVQNLKKNSFKTSIINECATFFYEKDFEKQLDSKCNLICFNNGVYDLDNELFREGTPDDYMKLTTGYDYLDFSESHPLILEILDFFKKIHTNKCKREYILTFIASCLHGEIVDQKCIFWTGSGSNGKSSEIDLIKHAFGEYFDTLPVSVITQKRAGSSQATPELADKRGKRFIVMNESEENEKIYVGTFKDITGGSDIYSRPLYKDPFTYKPQFKIVLCCNILPNITANDNGTWRRIRVVLHDSEFVDELKATSQDQNKFLKDKHLMAKLQQYKQAFMWLLIHMYYKKYKIQGLEEPKEVTSYTDKYKQDSDVFLEFNRDHIVTSSMDTYETMVTLYDEFKNWFKTSHPNSKVPEKKTLVNYLQTNKYTVDRGKIYGIKIQKSCN